MSALQLMLTFLEGAHLVSLEWSLVGLGLKLALDVGAHSKSTFAEVALGERELWKRAFWYEDIGFVFSTPSSDGWCRFQGVICVRSVALGWTRSQVHGSA